MQGQVVRELGKYTYKVVEADSRFLLAGGKIRRNTWSAIEADFIRSKSSSFELF
jgi:hypothetical protein